MTTRHVNVVVHQPQAGTVLDILYSSKKVFKVVRFNTVDSVHISFKVQSKHLEDVLIRLADVGCGKVYGTVDVFSLIATRPIISFKDNTIPSRKLYSISDRMTVDEIEDVVEDGNHMTFDYMALLAVASVIAGAGLLGDSPTAVIASMLVSPLMGPILSITFGFATMKMHIIHRGLRNEFLGVLISLIVGVVMGLCAYPVYGADFRSEEMMSRGKASGLLLGVVVAAASGMGVVLALSRGGFNVIVGTAISASLLPPVVNCGVCLAIAFLNWEHGRSRHNTNVYINTGLISMLLWVINFVIIIIIGHATFRYIKNIHPEPPLPTRKESSSLDIERASSNNSMLSDTLLRFDSNEDVQLLENV